MPVRQCIEEVLGVRTRGDDPANNSAILEEPGDVKLFPGKLGRVLHGEKQNAKVVRGAVGLCTHQDGRVERMQHGPIAQQEGNDSRIVPAVEIKP
jgi:hypothetical protein